MCNKMYLKARNQFQYFNLSHNEMHSYCYVQLLDVYKKHTFLFTSVELANLY